MWKTGEPPRDGRWVVELLEDGSGAWLWAWYEDEHGQVGWHDQSGGFDSDGHFPEGAIWAECPEGYVGLVERDDLALDDRAQT